MAKNITLVEKDGAVGIMQDGHVIWLDNDQKSELAVALLGADSLGEVANIVNERSRTHGDFIITGSIIAAMRDALKEGANWRKLPPVVRTSAEEICAKLARLANGSAKRDHMLDIIGYAYLALRVMSDEDV